MKYVVLDELRTPKSKRQLASDLNLSVSSVDETLTALLEQGIIETCFRVVDRTTAAQLRVLDALQGSPLSVSDLHHKTGLPSALITRLLKDLVPRGEVTRSQTYGIWLYSLP